MNSLQLSSLRNNIYKDVLEIYIKHLLQCSKVQQMIVQQLFYYGIIEVTLYPACYTISSLIFSSFHEQIIHQFPASLNCFFTAFLESSLPPIPKINDTYKYDISINYLSPYNKLRPKCQWLKPIIMYLAPDSVCWQGGLSCPGWPRCSLLGQLMHHLAAGRSARRWMLVDDLWQTSSPDWYLAGAGHIGGGWFVCLFYPGAQSVLLYMVFEKLPILQERVTSKLKYFPSLLFSSAQVPLDKQ